VCRYVQRLFLRQGKLTAVQRGLGCSLQHILSLAEFGMKLEGQSRLSGLIVGTGAGGDGPVGAPTLLTADLRLRPLLKITEGTQFDIALATQLSLRAWQVGGVVLGVRAWGSGTSCVGTASPTPAYILS
jgi:hypothetical protein